MKISVVQNQLQIFLTEQGEGLTQGEPAVFLRLSGCNLFCVWCDTDFTWNWQGTLFPHVNDSSPGYKKFSKKDWQQDLPVTDVVRRLDLLENAPRLVITGGEPLLQQAELVDLLEALLSQHPELKIEIETNGTKAPSASMQKFNVQYNVSPKLKNSRVPKNLRIKPAVLQQFSQLGQSLFKFVIQQQGDLQEIEELIMESALPQSKIWLMPCGTTTEELDEHMQWLKKAASSRGWQVTDRMHIRKNIP